MTVRPQAKGLWCLPLSGDIPEHLQDQVCAEEPLWLAGRQGGAVLTRDAQTCTEAAAATRCQTLRCWKSNYLDECMRSFGRLEGANAMMIIDVSSEKKCGAG